MPSYQTKIKGEPGWCEPEQHESYQEAAKLELDVLLSALDDDEDVAAQITVVVRDVATGTEVDVVFAAQEDGHYDVVETVPHHAHHVVDIARPGSEPPQPGVAALIESLPGKIVVVVLDGTEIRGRVTEAHRHGFGLAGMPGRFFAWGCSWKESTEPNIEKRLSEANTLQLAIDTRVREYSKAIERLRELASDETGDEIYDLTSVLRESIELNRCLRRLAQGRTAAEMHSAFGAPGDFGYDTPIGAALARVYQGQ